MRRWKYVPKRVLVHTPTRQQALIHALIRMHQNTRAHITKKNSRPMSAVFKLISKLKRGCLRAR